MLNINSNIFEVILLLLREMNKLSNITFIGEEVVYFPLRNPESAIWIMQCHCSHLINMEASRKDRGLKFI